MSSLDYLNKNEWRKLGYILVSAYIGPLFSVFIVYFITPMPFEVLIPHWIITLPFVYAIVYSSLSFLLLYYKGEKVFKILFFFNISLPVLVPICLIFFIGCVVIWGPHG